MIHAPTGLTEFTQVLLANELEGGIDKAIASAYREGIPRHPIRYTVPKGISDTVVDQVVGAYRRGGWNTSVRELTLNWGRKRKVLKRFIYLTQARP